MRKFWMISVSVCAFLLFQTTNAQVLTYGLNGGLNLSNISGESINDTNMRTGYHIGLLGRLELTDNFSLQPEIQYSQRGYKRDFSVGPTTTEFESRIDYVDIPLIAQYRITDGLAIEAGPQLGFFINESIKIDGEQADEDELSSSSFALAEVGIAGGLGYYLENGLFVQARYILGVTSIFDKDVITLNDDGVFNRNIQISLGYIFM